MKKANTQRHISIDDICKTFRLIAVTVFKHTKAKDFPNPIAGRKLLWKTKEILNHFSDHSFSTNYPI